jgi:hypothetical protein
MLSDLKGVTKESVIKKTSSSTVSQCYSHKPFVLSPWFDRLTTFGPLTVRPELVEGRVNGFLPFVKREGRN